MFRDFKAVLSDYMPYLLTKDTNRVIGLEDYIFKFDNNYGISVGFYNNSVQQEVLAKVLVFAACYDLYDDFSNEDVILDAESLGKLFVKVEHFKPKVWKNEKRRLRKNSKKQS